MALGFDRREWMMGLRRELIDYVLKIIINFSIPYVNLVIL